LTLKTFLSARFELIPYSMQFALQGWHR
jgi:hypothetical protein